MQIPYSGPWHTRIAPTPSGFLHVGNAFSFMLTWLLARASGGSVLLRIDDLDRSRYRQNYVDDIFATLDWLGIDYDRGPHSVQDFEQRWSQTLRVDMYHQFVEQLRQEGHLFACSCSRKTWQQHSPDGQTYPGLCLEKKLPFQDDYAWRIRRVPTVFASPKHNLAAEPLPPVIGDAFVVHQQNGQPAYQVASLLDDVHFSINAIVRGADLWPSTAYQLHLAHLGQLSVFADTCFLHHPLQLDGAGNKLSKSTGAAALLHWREAGRSPEPVFALVARYLHLPEGAASAGDLLALMKEAWL